MQGKHLVVAAGGEFYVSILLSDPAELVGNPGLGQFPERGIHVGDILVVADIPFDAIPSEGDASALLVEEVGLALEPISG